MADAHLDEINRGVPFTLSIDAEGFNFQGGGEGIAWDYDVAGIPFLSFASDEYPYQRQLEKLQKERVDNSDNPGDQSLSNWWTRAQTDWSGGAGQRWMEPISEDGVDRRFWQSAGVDVLTKPGKVSLLPAGVLDMSLDPLYGLSQGIVCAVQTRAGLAYAAGDTVVVDGTAQTVPGVPAGTDITGLVTAGKWLVATFNGGAAVMDIDMARSRVFSWEPFITVGVGGDVNPVRAWWVKNRLIVAWTSKVFELPGEPAAPLAVHDLLAPDGQAVHELFDIKDSWWRWTGCTDTPNSILMSGTDGSHSSIVAFRMDSDGKLPELTAPAVVAEFPISEQVWSIQSYLGAHIVVSTSNGVRIAQTDQQGGLVYGPLLDSPVAAHESDAFTAYDRFVSYPIRDAGDGRPGLARIDLSEIDKDGRAAWSTFLRLPEGTDPAESVFAAIATGARTGLLVTRDTGGGAHVYTFGEGVYEHGWLQSSLVRFGTLEEKSFHSVKVVLSSPVGDGYIRVSAQGEEGGPWGVGTLDHATGHTEDLDIGARTTLESLRLIFDFHPAAGTTDDAPHLEAWRLKALPNDKDRSEQVLLPMLNFDFMNDQHGVTVGYEGRAWEVWRALIQRLTSAGSLKITEWNSGATYMATVEDCSFTQIAPPVRASGFGGIIQLVLKADQAAT